MSDAYSALLRDPRWQRKRLEVLQEANFKCSYCFDGSKTLHAHHAVYHRGMKPWEYKSFEVICLCEDCHKKWHEDKILLDRFYGALSPEHQELVRMRAIELLQEELAEEAEIDAYQEKCRKERESIG